MAIVFENEEIMTAKSITAKYPGGEYPLYIGKGLIENQALLRQHIRSKQVMIVSNDPIAALYLKPVRDAFNDYQCDVMLLPDGEQHKTVEQVSKIWDALAEKQHHRDTTLIALGGGVVGDMTGFAAACYHRGVDFIQIPTTLLAQADASIGGKTAVDHPCGKNLIGAFHQPVAVIMDINTLSTLPDREFRAGISEIIKAALIKDKDFFQWLENHIEALLAQDPQIIIETLQRACQIKCDIVTADEKEQGMHSQRALCNLGHTFGHAIEQNLSYGDWLHGEAVALGIIMAADLSVTKGWLSEEERTRIKDIFTQIDMPKHLPSEIKCDTLLATMWSDKKVINNQSRLVLLKRIGQAVVTTDVTEKEISELLAHYSK